MLSDHDKKLKSKLLSFLRNSESEVYCDLTILVNGVSYFTNKLLVHSVLPIEDKLLENTDCIIWEHGLNETSLLVSILSSPPAQESSVFIESEALQYESFTYDEDAVITEVHSNEEFTCNRQAEITESKIDSHMCSYCGKIFKSRKSLSKHVYNSHNFSRMCKICGKWFNNSGSYSKHMSDHTEKGTECPICGKIVKYRRDLDGHIETHHKKKEIKCSKCGKRFSMRRYLQQHISKFCNMES